MRTKCQYPGCSEPPRKADAEFQFWNSDHRPVFCDPHDDQIQNRQIPYKYVDDEGNIRDGHGKVIPKLNPAHSACDETGCKDPAVTWCSLCSSEKKGRKVICRGHSRRPMTHSREVVTCPGCASKWKEMTRRKLWTFSIDPATGIPGLTCYVDYRGFAEVNPAAAALVPRHLRY